MRRHDDSRRTVVPIDNRRNDPWTAARTAVRTWDAADALAGTQDRVQTQHHAGAQAIGVLRALLAAHDDTPAPA